MAESFEERQTVMLEGMYKGVASKIDELKQSIDKELLNSNEQQASSTEAISESVHQGIESILAELRYISQQNSAIYDYSKSERASFKEDTVAALDERCEDIVSAVTDYVDKMSKALSEQLNAKIDELGQVLLNAIQQVPAQVPAFITVEQRNAEEEPVREVQTVREIQVPAAFSDENFDYNLLAEKIASMLPETDYDMIADKVVSALPQQDDVLVDKVVAAIPQQDENALADRLAEVIPLTDYDLIAEKVSAVLENEFEVTVGEEGLARITNAVVEQLDYDRISAKVVELLKEEGLDYEQISARVSELVKPEQIDYDQIAVRVAEFAARDEIDYEELAVKVAEIAKNEELDYELLAEKVAELVKSDEEEDEEEEVEEEVVEPEPEPESEPAPEPVVQEIDYERIAALVAELVKPEEIDYDQLAEKVAERAKPEEIDYDQLAEKVAEKAKPEEIDYDQLAQRVAEIAKPEEFDYDQLAQKVAEIAKPEEEEEEDLLSEPEPVSQEIDYERIASRVAELVKTGQPDYEDLAARVSELSQSTPDYEALMARIAELTKLEDSDIDKFAEKVEEILKDYAPAVAPVQPEEEQEAAAEYALASALAKKNAVRKPGKKVVIPAPAEPELVTRMKRSFTAKLVESEEDVKEYYSEIKNTILGYSKTNSQINWSNDRFTFERETIAKIAIRGKTLCLYLALNPDEFPNTVYHQKFAGDNKMYEKTPMLVKIKSVVTLKRAIRLVELLMEVQGAVKEDREKVDYAKQYPYRTENELVAEGLIKTAVVPKNDMSF